MTIAKKTSYSNEFKFKVALEAVKACKTVAELVIEYSIARSLIHKWKQQLLDNGVNAFTLQAKQAVDNDEQKLYEQLGRQAMEITYLKKIVNRCH